ncbi:hypothetical protein CORC01_13483 [Colletotrichum orchidophilum]|uniref:TPR domain-containing protein n=1 Tax=Colletotrichum orchidophilum TaxID=1209926 RepID=A0A1G4AQ19_9PEZI|nr:uncharacterized protein CORC01_13483 [Colletotrichum orchidophilum]OHE91206.1 hypothetical protein CORC01_13483 [Colletotrichum orchidophilum]
MFRLATVPTRGRGGRQLAAGLTTPPSTRVSAPAPAPTMTTTRTLKTKGKLRPAPGLERKASKANQNKPLELVLEPRSLTEFKIRIREIEKLHVTAERAHDIYMKYMKALARDDKPKDWQKNFIKENNFMAAELHETAGILFEMRNRTESEFILRANMMEASAGLGFDAAALTLGRCLWLNNLRKGDYYDWDHPRWENARIRCQALFAEGRDANAMVLSGLLHLKRKTSRDDYLALEAFAQALELGKDAAHFDWLGTALEGQGDAYLRLGEKAKAEESFVALATLGYARGYHRLAKIFPDAPETMGFLWKAAAAGITSSYELLVELCEKRRRDCVAKGDMRSAEDYERDATEWTRILKASKAPR